MRRVVLWLSMSLLAGGCRSGDRARTALSDSTATPAVEPGSAAGTVALQLWELRPGITLGQWKAAHPDEPISGADSAGLGAWLGEWCAAAQKTTLVGGRPVTRTALFYPPEPEGLALPDSVPDLVRRCVLGAILVTAAVPDTTRAGALADSLARELTRIFSAPATGPLRAFGTNFWDRPRRFQKGDLSMLTAIRHEQLANGADAGTRAVVALGLLPISRLSLDSAAPARFVVSDTLPLDSAARTAGLDTALYHALRALMDHQPRQPTSMRTGADLVRPLTRWIRAAAALPPPRRAAALYVADQVLDRAMCGYRLCDAEGAAARASLAALGASFPVQDDGWTNGHRWLVMARALDRDSPVGQRILVYQLARGFDLAGQCTAGSEAFRRVIAEGERYLARVPDAKVAPEVHFLVGEAEDDIVALAHGAGGLDADSSRYGAEAGAAARQALAHYQAATRAGPAAPVAREAWRRAWWLKAGLAPRRLRFYCIGPDSTN